MAAMAAAAAAAAAAAGEQAMHHHLRTTVLYSGRGARCHPARRRFAFVSGCAYSNSGTSKSPSASVYVRAQGRRGAETATRALPYAAAFSKPASFGAVTNSSRHFYAPLRILGWTFTSCRHSSLSFSGDVTTAHARTSARARARARGDDVEKPRAGTVTNATLSLRLRSAVPRPRKSRFYMRNAGLIERQTENCRRELDVMLRSVRYKNFARSGKTLMHPCNRIVPGKNVAQAFHELVSDAKAGNETPFTDCFS
jgi:hypothetical protein